MSRDISINIKSILGSLAVITFLVLLFGISHKYYSPDFKISDNIFIGAAIVFGFVLSIGVHATTDLGLLFSFTLGYIPAFIMLGLITPIGWIFLFLDFLLMLFIAIIYYSRE